MRRIAAILTAALLLLLGATPATAAPAPLGGGSILTTAVGSYRCTVAFAARSNTAGVLITGPGCAAPSGTQLYSNGVLVGPVSGSTANGAVTTVTVTNTAAWQLVPWIQAGGTRVWINGSAETPVGGSVCLLDRTVGTHCGTIVAKNQTVNYPDGTLYGLTRTNVCMEPGGGPIAFVSGSQAQGIPVGASGSCSTGGSSFFWPVNRVLSAYGLTLVTG
ncbi:MAG: S1 family peptidase [Actinomycetota bacterium]|nr:S1 family peptidase [Actinomycetota bacterium]